MTFPAASAIHRGLGRFEVFDVAPERLPALAVHVLCSPLPFSVHAPLSREDPGRNPSAVFFLSDSRERARGFADLERALRAAVALGAEYLVTHLNWTEDVLSEARAEALAHDAGARLAALSCAHGIAIHLAGIIARVSRPPPPVHSAGNDTGRSRPPRSPSPPARNPLGC